MEHAKEEKHPNCKAQKNVADQVRHQARKPIRRKITSRSRRGAYIQGINKADRLSAPTIRNQHPGCHWSRWRSRCIRTSPYSLGNFTTCPFCHLGVIAARTNDSSLLRLQRDSKDCISTIHSHERHRLGRGRGGRDSRNMIPRSNDQKCPFLHMQPFQSVRCTQNCV